MPGASVWDKTKSGGKKGFDKVYAVVDKLGAPVNRLSNKLGAEAFWPTSLDKESDKAARILKSFCKDGFYTEKENAPADGPKQKQRVLKKIPSEVIANAKGLAVFTTMRTGLWMSGAGGSGILVARLPDGTWSGPSGIMLHTAGLGFLVGVDIYDCVVVINTKEALDAFSKVRCTLGGEISAVAGPVGMGGVLESEVHKRRAPIFTYLKSRGFYAGVQVDGTIVIERTDENEAFYGERISVGDILAGKPRHVPESTKTLMETIRAAQGDLNIDESLLPGGPAPGDVDLETEKPASTFGVPDSEDPDPYGVLALESAGMEIREAGTRSRPTSEQFEYKPSPTSPTFGVFHRRSMRSISSVDNSFRKSIDQGTQTEDRGVQTDDLPDPPPRLSRPPRRKESLAEPQLDEIKEAPTQDHQPEKLASDTQVQTESSEFLGVEAPITRESTNGSRLDTESNYSADLSEREYLSGETNPYESDVEIHDGEDDEMDEHIAEEATAVTYGVVQSPVRSNFKVKMVAIPKRVPPKLPTRNPRRRLKLEGHENAEKAEEAPSAHEELVQSQTQTGMVDSPIVSPIEQVQAEHPSDLDEVAITPPSAAEESNPWLANGLDKEDPTTNGIAHSQLEKPVPADDAFYSIPSSPAVETPIRHIEVPRLAHSVQMTTTT